jgi:hypothetical protein
MATIDEFMDSSDDRSTGEVIEVLGDDIDRCFEAVMKCIKEGKKLDDGCTELLPDYDFHARQFIRSVFAFLEGAAFVVRVWAAAHLDRLNRIEQDELLTALEMRSDLDGTGQVVTTKAKIPMSRMLKFTFALLDRLHEGPPKLDTSQEWWSCLQSSMRVRDRIMHPKLPSDLDVSVEEVVSASKAEVGFRMLVGS